MRTRIGLRSVLIQPDRHATELLLGPFSCFEDSALSVLYFWRKKDSPNDRGVFNQYREGRGTLYQFSFLVFYSFSARSRGRMK
jgi:hypothetical protein